MNGDGSEEVVDFRAREIGARALESSERSWEGLANVLRELAAMRIWMDERFDQLEGRMRRRLASVSDIARESAEDVVRTGRHKLPTSSFPPKRVREGFKAMIGGGILNMIWVAIGVLVSIFVRWCVDRASRP